MKKIAALAAAACLAACIDSTGGSGLTKSGDPVAARMDYNPQTSMFDISIHSPKGWTCAATFKKSNQNMKVRTVPLTCTDGRNGNLVMSANQYQGQAVGSFALSDGESGQVTFGVI